MSLSLKLCTLCKESKDLGAFSFSKTTNRYLSRCKQCIAKKTQAWRIANYDHYRAYNAQYQIDNPDIKHKSQKKYRQKNRAVIYEKSKEYIKRRPEVGRMTTLVRRARKKSNGIFLILPKELKRLINSPCFYCGKLGPSELDHIIPISKGGRHSIGNLISSCRSCNARKSNKTIMEFITE